MKKTTSESVTVSFPAEDLKAYVSKRMLLKLQNEVVCQPLTCIDYLKSLDTAWYKEVNGKMVSLPNIENMTVERFWK